MEKMGKQGFYKSPGYPGYPAYNQCAQEFFEDSHWVLMLNHVPDRIIDDNRLWKDQESVIDNWHYSSPWIAEVAVCIFSDYLTTNHRFSEENRFPSTICFTLTMRLTVEILNDAENSIELLIQESHRYDSWVGIAPKRSL